MGFVFDMEQMNDKDGYVWVCRVALCSRKKTAKFWINIPVFFPFVCGAKYNKNGAAGEKFRVRGAFSGGVNRAKSGVIGRHRASSCVILSNRA